MDATKALILARKIRNCESEYDAAFEIVNLYHETYQNGFAEGLETMSKSAHKIIDRMGAR